MNKLYKSLLLAVLMLSCGMVSAQNLFYDFENCNVGDKVAATLGEPWTTWDYAPGSATDAVVTDEISLGTRAIKIDNGNDLVLKLGDKTTGDYRIEFDMYIPEGKESYFNILHEFAGSNNSVWAQQMWLQSQQYGNHFYPGGTYDPFDVPYNEWLHIVIDVNLDHVWSCMVKINDELILVWNYAISYSSSSGSGYTNSPCLSAMDFFPSCADPNGNGFFVDNISITKVEGSFEANIVPQDESLNIVMAKDEQKTVTTTIDNEGNLITQYLPSWIEFGEGQDGGEPQMMHYDSEPNSINNFNAYDYNYIEVGAVYLKDIMDSFSVMGTKVTKIQYYLPASASSAIEGPLTFSLYRCLSSYNNTIVLAEKELTEYNPGVWNTVELDEPVPITGFNVLAAVGFHLVNNKIPISIDAGTSYPYSFMYQYERLGWFSMNDYYLSIGGQGFGSVNIRLVCEGIPVESQWINNITNTAFAQYFVPGHSNVTTFEINTTGLDFGEYEATYRFERPSYIDPEIAIPIKLKVTGTNVDEVGEGKCQIYPNPASDIVFFKGEDLRYVILFNAAGEQVGIKKIEGNTISVNDVKDGLYQACIIDSKGNKTVQKLVISR